MALNKDFKVKNGATITQDLSVGGNAYLNALTGTNATFDKLTATEFEASSAIFTKTIVTSTSALSVINNGTGPALYVRQKGASQPIAEFVDQEGGVIYFADTGNLGINTKDPNEKLTVSGKVSATNNLSALRVAVCNTSYGGFISGGRDLADIFATTASSGSVCGTGTAGRITKWSGTTQLTDSIAREAGSQFTIDGSLSATSNLSAAGNATISGNVSAAGNLSGYNVNPRGDIFLDEDQRIYFENDHATWIESHAADSFRIVADGNQMLLLDYDTGNRAVFGNGTKVFIGSNNNALPEEALTVSGNISSNGNLSASGKNGYNYLEGRLGINTNRPDYMLDVAGSVGIGACLIHNGDDDTFIYFTEDDINIQAGGVNFIDITQDTASEITFNEAGADVDFRVEGTTDNGLLYTDAGTDKVGIGTRTPNEKLTVAGNISACNTVQACSISANSTNGGIVSAGRDLADIFVTTSGNVDGSGTANFLPSWSDSNTLTNSIACQTSTQLTVAGNVSACGGLSATEMNSYFGCNVGIGTNTPDYTLDVAGDIGVDQYIYHNGDPNTYINLTNDRLRFNIGGISYIDLNDAGAQPHDITFNDGGNNVDIIIKGTGANEGNPLFKTDANTNKVGINGISVPNEELTVSGNISATGTLSAERVAVCNSSYGGFISGGRDLADIFATSSGNIDGSGTANYLPVFSDSNTIENSIACQTSTQLTVAGNVSACGGLSATQMNSYFDCKVGIGTCRPAETLHVDGNILIPQGKALRGYYGGSLPFDIIGMDSTTDTHIYGANNNSSDIFFDTCSGGTLQTRMAILNSGCVGIGTTTPGQKLTVAGNVSACGGLSATQMPSYFACNVGINTNWPTSYLQVSALKTIDRDLVVICGGGASGNYDGLRVEAGNGTDLFRVNQLTYDVLMPSSGKVGIGNTAPGQKLTVSGNVSACGGLSATKGVGYFACKVGIGTCRPDQELTVAGNLKLTSTYPRIFLQDTNNDSDFSIINNDGSFGIYDDTNTTYRASITPAGNFGIGNTTPNEKLTVAGNISATGTLSAERVAVCNSSYGGFISGGRDLADIFETCASSVDGSGTANYIAQWSDTDTLTNSLLSGGTNTVTVAGNVSACGGATIVGGLTAGSEQDNTAPTLIKLLNGGSGSATGAKIEFPYSSCIHSRYTGGISLCERTGTELTVYNDSVCIKGTAPTVVFDTTGETTLRSTAAAGTDVNFCFPGDYNFCTFESGWKKSAVLTCSGNLSARGSILGTSISGTNVNASSTSRGFVSAGRDLADIFATSSGNVDGSGIACFLPVWSDTDTIGNSIVCQTSTQLTVAGNISACGGLSATQMNSYFDCKVGIGTCRPEAPLHVNAAGGTLSQFHRNGTQLVTIGGSSNQGQIRFQQGSDCISTGATTGGDYRIDTGGSVGAGDNMFYVCKGGNVGIGNTAPNEKLTVAGNVSACGGLSATKMNSYFACKVGIGISTPTADLHIKDASGDPTQILLEDADGGTQTAKIVFDQTAQNSLVLSTQYQSSTDLNLIQFAPADNVAMTIRGGTGSSDGNVGIGTAAPNEKLTVAGNISACGVLSAADAIRVPDSTCITLGNSQDLKLYHDGSNSYIRDESGTGDLIVSTNAYRLKSANNGETMMTAFEDGAVNLYHNNITRFRTDASGVDIVGGLSACNTRNGFVSAGRDLADIFATSSGNVDGTGTKFKIPQWNDTDTIGDSPLSAVNDGVSLDGNLTLGDGHFIGDDSFDNLTIISSSGENLVAAAANDIYLNTDASGGGTGTNRVRIDETGVGIGNITPNEKLTVAGNISACGGLSATQMPSYFACSVGIGNNRPGTFGSDGNSLVVGSGSGGQGITIFAEDNNNANLYFADATSGTGSYVGYVQYRHSENKMAFGVSAGRKMTIDGNGYVGIGENSPQYPLHICQSGAATLAIQSNGNDDEGSKLRLIEGSSNWLGGYVQYDGADNNLILGVHADNNTTLSDDNPVIIIPRDTGKVGIGTATPNEKLTVAGNISACGGLSATEMNSYFGCSVGVGVTTPNAQLHVSNSSSPTFRLSRTGTGQIWQQGIDSSGRFLLQEAASEGGTQYTRLEIDDAGDTCLAHNGGCVGIGTAGPEQKLTVAGNISACGGLSATKGVGYFACKVGIGTCRPETSLDIYSSVDQQTFCIQGANSSVTPTARIRTTSTGSVLLLETATTSDSRDILKAKNSSGTVLNLQADGKLGIGTEVPNETLTVAGNISACGVLSAADAIRVPDSTCITLGNSEDLKLYHDGSNSYINETGTGDLYICGGNDIIFKDAVGNLLANMNQSNSVELYYGGSKKFETTNTGSKTSGSICATNDLNVDGDASVRALTVTRGASVTRGVSASSTHNGFVSAGRDLADIFATSSGNVDGTGTACFLPVWSDTDTIGNSIACQSSTQLTVAGNISACGGLSATEMNSYFGCKVGIGTNRPAYNLHIQKYDTTGPTIELQNSEYSAWINAWGSGASAGRTSRMEINAGSTNFAVGATTIRFQTPNVGDSNEKMRIDATGCVGIGTCAPQSLLHVAGGDIRIDNNRRYQTETASGGVIDAVKMDSSDNLVIGDCNIKIDVSGTTPRMTIGTDSCACGFVGIGNDNTGCVLTPNERLTVGGGVSASGNGYFACVIAGGYFEEKAANATLACYPTGTLVVIGECGDLIQSTRENDKKVFGVTQNGVCQPIVLGAEPVLVTGDIKIGDYITTSDKPGHGRKTRNPIYGSVIAQSMEAGAGDSHLVKAMIRKM